MTSHSDKTAEATTAEAKKHQIALMFSGLVIVMLMSALNQTILAPSLPTIVGELHGVEHMSWVIATFILLSTITMPVYGKLSDQFGRKPFLIFAILSFMTGSIIGALAPDMTWLIVARALQGVGGGGLMILSQSVVADVIPARERGKYMGIIGGVFAFSSVAGPLIGGGGGVRLRLCGAGNAGGGVREENVLAASYILVDCYTMLGHKLDGDSLAVAQILNFHHVRLLNVEALVDAQLHVAFFIL